MRLSVLGAMLAATISIMPATPAKAYDMDCAIMLCMAGGFPPSAVCAAAYAEMIRRITPWPSRPPFGICTFAAVPAALRSAVEARGFDALTPIQDAVLEAAAERWDWTVAGPAG